MKLIAVKKLLLTVVVIGAVEFKLHKSNFRGVLRTVEQVSKVEMKFEQEGIKDERKTVARRGNDDQNTATLELNSDPADAEIEIDGAFVGTTPRTKKLKPGEYRIAKKGYKSWERKITLEATGKVPLKIDLEKW